jgi:hypothetical protein
MVKLRTMMTITRAMPMVKIVLNAVAFARTATGVWVMGFSTVAV